MIVFNNTVAHCFSFYIGFIQWTLFFYSQSFLLNVLVSLIFCLNISDYCYISA